jgi:hypothetical protein
MNVKSITGTVSEVDGSPIEGVVVTDAHLNYSETNSSGQFAIRNPELALFFWCPGFLPRARVLSRNELAIEIVLERTVRSRVSA